MQNHPSPNEPAEEYLVAAREARVERNHARRLQRAEQQTRAALQEAYLMQARAGRRTGLKGCRFESLEALRRAAAMTNSLALRNEAIGCLALADLRLRSTLPIEPGDREVLGLDGQALYCPRRRRCGPLAPRQRRAGIGGVSHHLHQRVFAPI